MESTKVIMDHGQVREAFGARSARILLAAMVLAWPACAPTVKSAARQASQAAVDQSVEELNRGETKSELKDAAQDPRVAEATAKMSEQIADGIVRSLASPETQGKLTSASAAVVDAASRQMIRNLGTRESKAVFVSLASAASDEVLTGLGGHLQKDLRPALQGMLKEDIAQGVAAGLASPEFQSSLTRTAQSAGLGAVRGVEQGLTTSWQDRGTSSMGGLRSLSEKGATWLTLLVILAGLVTLALLLGALMVLAQGRRARTEVARLESAALLLSAAVQRTGGDLETREIVAAVRESLEHSTRAKLSLNERPHLWSRQQH